MFLVLLHLLLVRSALSSDSEDILEALNLITPVKRAPDKPFLAESCFPSLDHYHVNAMAAKESMYPWIARVVHSRSADIPHICTAICIDDAIYITAARCIYTLKVQYTTIFHMSKRFEALAFVLPSKPTKQMFDDIGIIIVDKMKGVKKWSTIELFDKINRTDDRFQWFKSLNTNVGKLDYKVVGYTLDKGIHKVRAAERKFELRELKVIVSHNLCFEILDEYRGDVGFKVPCYHSCTHAEFKRKKKVKDCNNYLGVEGAAVIEIKSKKLVGVATWGIYYAQFEMPVGFSVVNSENFFKDLSCAKLIRGAKSVNNTKGFYQHLCDSS